MSNEKDAYIAKIERENQALRRCVTRIRSLQPRHADFPGQLPSASYVVLTGDIIDAVEDLKTALAANNA